MMELFNTGTKNTTAKWLFQESKYIRNILGSTWDIFNENLSHSKRPKATFPFTDIDKITKMYIVDSINNKSQDGMEDDNFYRNIDWAKDIIVALVIKIGDITEKCNQIVQIYIREIYDITTPYYQEGTFYKNETLQFGFNLMNKETRQIEIDKQIEIAKQNKQQQ